MTRLSRLVLGCVVFCGLVSSSRGVDRPNVLFIAVDDMRTNIGCYRDPIAITPNIDALARQSVQFNRAYCQVAVCNPSRQSLLTGMRPDTIKVWNLVTHFRQTSPGLVTLPEHFKNNGYFAQSFGKIFHGEKPMADPPSWSVPETFEYGGKHEDYQQPANKEGKGKQAAIEVTDAPDEAYIDGQVAAGAVKALNEMKDRPFFLAVGFRKPHLPFTTPKKYWDMYEKAAIGMPAHPEPPTDAPQIALHNSEELRGYTDIPETGPLNPDQILQLRRGYYACTTFTDAQIGKVIGELDRLHLREKTIIVFWSDHGYHLGEQNLWSKTTNYELDTRVPFLLSVPETQYPKGVKSDAFVELIDIYPTLLELTGLKEPQKLEGTSMVRLLSQPDRAWKTAAFSQFGRPFPRKMPFKAMGYAVRTDRYRYVEWLDTDSWQVLARELYDYQADPDETRNIAGSAEAADIVKQQSRVLHAGWRGAQPAHAAN